ncbi:hypothetical protein [Spirosoma fluminis]
MILTLLTINQESQFQSFVCSLDTVEKGFELLTSIVSKGDVLITATLIEEGEATELPTEVFDGQPFLEPIQQLEMQWQAILNPPIDPVIDRSELLTWTRKRIQQYEQRLICYELTISYLEKLLDKTQESFAAGCRRDRLISRYRVLIDQKRQYAKKIQVRHQLTVERLAQLS